MLISSARHYATIVLQGDKLFYSPLDKDSVKKVLDVGTGTGHWAM
jgi:hypothetical protein